jgi:hypothetical protein
VSAAFRHTFLISPSLLSYFHQLGSYLIFGA